MINYADIFLFSGGMDSFISHELLRHKHGHYTQPVYIDYGGKYCHRETDIALELLPFTKIVSGVINLSRYEQENNTIKNRNLLLAAIASMTFPGATSICMGTILAGKTAGRSDGTEEALQAFSDALTKSNSGIRHKVWSLRNNMEKDEVIEEAITYFGDDIIPKILRTTSCYSPFHNWCGECKGCAERYVALALNDIFDPKMEEFKRPGELKRFLETSEDFSEKKREHLLIKLSDQFKYIP